MHKNLNNNSLIRILYNKNTSAPKATGIIIDKDGHFITAKHAVDLHNLNNYTAFFLGSHLPLFLPTYPEKKKKIFSDIILLKTPLNQDAPFTKLNSVANMQHLLDEQVIISGYDKEELIHFCTKIINVNINDVFELENGYKGPGFSGAVVFLKHSREPIGIISGRVETHSMKIHACSVNHIFKNYFVYKRTNRINANRRDPSEKQASKYKNDALAKFYYANLNDKYAKSGNPIKIYKELSHNIEDLKEKGARDEFYYGKLHELAGNLLINNNANSDIAKRARKHLQLAADIILERDPTQERDESYTRIMWLHSITYKQQYNLEKAHSMCEDTCKRALATCNSVLTRSKDFFKPPNKTNFSHFIMLQREIAILRHKNSFFSELESLLHSYVNNKSIFIDKNEIFHTWRRIFEYWLHKDNLEKCTELLPHLDKSYRRCRSSITKVYDVSYRKNIMHYNLILDPKKAIYYFKPAEVIARENDLVGQLSEINLIYNSRRHLLI
jgi:hypothetical protein